MAGKGRTVFASKLGPLVDGLIDEVIEDADIGRHWGDILHQTLPERRFDLILDSQRRVPTTLALKRLRHARFVSASANYLFSDVRPLGAPAGFYRKPPSMICQMLELVALARFGRGDAELDISSAIKLPAEVRIEASRLLQDGAHYVAMAPGAGNRIKYWPLDRFAALGRRLAEDGLTPIYLLGPQETKWGDTLRALVPGAELPLSRSDADLALEPLLTIGLAAQADVCIANDRGIGHLFAAWNTPLVSLFGLTPAAKFAPAAKRPEIINAASFGSQAMSAIPVDAVSAAVDKLIA